MATVKVPTTPPQQVLDKFWKKFSSKESGRPITTLPGNSKAKRAARKASLKAAAPRSATVSYEQAAAKCKDVVQGIIKDCRRLNQKFKDPDFDIEDDHNENNQWGKIPDSLVSLGEEHDHLTPKAVKRVHDIFDKPRFVAEGMTAIDVRQGSNGDCWWMAAVCNLSNNEDWLNKLCVDRDEDVGVYGFVFYRDGEWIWEVIDDKLYLTRDNFDDAGELKGDWLASERERPDEVYRKIMQTGSNALYFASCRDQNATWLPLLEKAYAKAHGDYGSIEGGWVGEGIEDLTGGVTSDLFTADILHKDKFWTDELMNVNKQFLFGLTQMTGKFEQRKGIISHHTYSIMKVDTLEEMVEKELDGKMEKTLKVTRLVKIKNPWGLKTWEGPWSDGSEEWTPERMITLNHRFKKDGSFWIEYEDMLKHWQHIDRTRIFEKEWIVTQQWTSAPIPYAIQYLDKFFRLSLTRPTSVVIMLCQLDDRYFKGLQGQYGFRLQFCLLRSSDKTHVVQSRPSYYLRRSATVELDLEAGDYDVMVKIQATRYSRRPKPAAIVMHNWVWRPQKLLKVGKNYDLAHAKGGLKENEVERIDQIRTERREKRKAEHKKAFEARRLAHKKNKLRKRRLEAKAKAPKKNDDDGSIAIQITMGAKSLEPKAHPDRGKAGAGMKTVPYDLDGRLLKLTIETSDKAAATQRGTYDPHTKKDKDTVVDKQVGHLPQTEGPEDPAQTEKTKDKLHDEQAEHTRGNEERKETSETKQAEDSTVKPAEASTSDPESSQAPTPASSTPDINADPTAVEAEPPISHSASAEAGTQALSAKISIPNKETPARAAVALDGSPLAEEKELTLDDISDDGLSWCSDIDAPPDSDSESESSDSDSETKKTPEVAEPKKKVSDNNDSGDEDEEDDKTDAWDAVCVFGLRVYAKGAQATIEVDRVKEGEEKERKEEGKEKGKEDGRATVVSKKQEKHTELDL